MREIMFRAEYEGKIYPVAGITFGGGYSGDGKSVTLIGDGLIWSVDLKKVNLLQYTGLKDRNGKEIYEGDVFECIYHYDGHRGHRYVVTYSEENAQFYLKRHGVCPLTSVTQTMRDASRHIAIGNIYENPELLTCL